MCAKNTKDQNPIRFRRTDVIGFPDAESDTDFLNECFIETGDIEVLKNCSDPRCLVPECDGLDQF